MDTIVIFDPAPGPATAGDATPAILLDSTSTASSYETIAYTPESGSNRAVFLCVGPSHGSGFGANSTLSVPTWGGEAGTLVAEQVITGTGATGAVYVWVEADFPTAGSTFTITPGTPSDYLGVTAVVVMETGVDQTTPVDATNTEDRADRSRLTLSQSNGKHMGFSVAAQNSATAGTISATDGTLLLSDETGFGGFEHRSWALVEDSPGASGLNTIFVVRTGSWWTTADGAVSWEVNPA